MAREIVTPYSIVDDPVFGIGIYEQSPSGRKAQVYAGEHFGSVDAARAFLGERITPAELAAVPVLGQVP